jgi:diaminohydroxyphosphoribosylaminopyrimidine deaminase / 5-amino-6-(5-phosphoribosylamino)uracil reductase
VTGTSGAEERAMRRALALAGRSNPHPNPRVGAVVLDGDGQAIAEGWHVAPGQAHAERVALANLDGPPPVDSTLVVTLEPCDHHGRTPPCTQAIIASGIRRVVVGAVDPDPRVGGSGIEHLQEVGIEVEVGLLSTEIEAADTGYFHHRRHGRPRLTLKAAITLDGQTAAADGTSQWITGPAARRDAHLLRSRADAVMVGAGTLRTDDPTLTVRIDGYAGSQPRAVVVAGHSPLPAEAAVWQRPGSVVVATSDPEIEVESVVVDPGPDGLPRLDQAVHRLGEMGMLEILVEGGATLAAGLWRSGLVDAGVTYVGARMAGGAGLPALAGAWATFVDSRPVDILSAAPVGKDVRIDWEPVRESDTA